MKTCIKCGVPKAESEFYFRPNRSANVGACKQCNAQYRAALRALDPEKHKAYFDDYNRNRRVPDPEKGRIATRKWRVAHPEQNKQSSKNSKLKAAYGITREDLLRMTEEQKGLCAVCGDNMSQPCVDHCHSTGKIRMLLCHSCNLALGMFKDSAKTCFMAASYLQKFSS